MAVAFDILSLSALKVYKQALAQGKTQEDAKQEAKSAAYTLTRDSFFGTCMGQSMGNVFSACVFSCLWHPRHTRPQTEGTSN